MNTYGTFLETFTHNFVKWTGTSWGFTVAFGISFCLVIAGLFMPAQLWGDLLTVFTGIASFLMIFLMQRSQNKDFMAINVKLNELIAAQEGADSKLINIETSSEHKIKNIHEQHEQKKS